MFDRRLFLKSSGLALVAGGFIPNVFVRMAEAGAPPSRRVLVAIFQRGAVDGLNVLVPYGEKTYYDARPTIAVPRPGSGAKAALDLDGFFGLHPSLAPLLPLFRDRSAAFVHAAGSPDATRSHFDAQDFMESGTPGVKSTADGFLSRALAGEKAAKSSPLRAVAMSPGMPRILSGSSGAIAMTSLARFGVRAPRAARRSVLRVHVRGHGTRRAPGDRAGVLRGRSDRPFRRPVADRAAKWRRVSAQPARAVAPRDRPAHQVGRRNGDRLHRRRRLGHPRRRGGPARQPAARLRRSPSPPSRRTSARAWATSRSSPCPSSAAP